VPWEKNEDLNGHVDKGNVWAYECMCTWLIEAELEGWDYQSTQTYMEWGTSNDRSIVR
jgi:hypothetical protein